MLLSVVGDQLTLEVRFVKGPSLAHSGQSCPRRSRGDQGWVPQGDRRPLWVGVITREAGMPFRLSVAR
jgi:hypothetical protein